MQKDVQNSNEISSFNELDSSDNESKSNYNISL